MRLEWVHPSWRDLVIERLASDAAARRRFLAGAGIDGVKLALSTGGGREGERALPLLHDDADWDALTDRVSRLVGELDEAHVVALLLTLRTTYEAVDERVRPEAEALARYALDRLRRDWDRASAPIPLDLLEAWLELREQVGGDLPDLHPTWTELSFAKPPRIEDTAGMRRLADWLRLLDMLPEDESETELLGPDASITLINTVVRNVRDQIRSPTRRQILAADWRAVAVVADQLQRHGLLNESAVSDWSVPAQEPAWYLEPSTSAGNAERSDEHIVTRILRDL